MTDGNKILISLVFNYIALGDLESAKEVIEDHSLDVNCANDQGTTVLHLSTRINDFSAVKFLLAKRASVNARENDVLGGYTPLHHAIRNNNKEIAEYLIRQGADLEATDALACTPLLLACRAGFTELATHLIDKGSNIDVKDSTGKTPYYWASEFCYDDVIKVLGAPPAPYDPMEETPEVKAKLAMLKGLTFGRGGGRRGRGARRGKGKKRGKRGRGKKGRKPK